MAAPRRAGHTIGALTDKRAAPNQPTNSICRLLIRGRLAIDAPKFSNHFAERRSLEPGRAERGTGAGWCDGRTAPRHCDARRRAIGKFPCHS